MAPQKKGGNLTAETQSTQRSAEVFRKRNQKDFSAFSAPPR